MLCSYGLFCAMIVVSGKDYPGISGFIMSNKNRILNKLRRAQQPFNDLPVIDNRRKMINLADTSADALKARFIEEAEKISCSVYPAEDDTEALNKLLSLIDEVENILAWDDNKLPFPIESALSEKQITIASPDDAHAPIGITGVDAALAGTGSLIVSSGHGKYRTASLLPDKHIALVRVSQIMPDFETWIQSEKESGLDAFKQSSNTTIISGPSKTADIAQELIKGAHGPRQVHIILIDN